MKKINECAVCHGKTEQPPCSWQAVKNLPINSHIKSPIATTCCSHCMAGKQKARMTVAEFDDIWSALPQLQ